MNLNLINDVVCEKLNKNNSISFFNIFFHFFS